MWVICKSGARPVRSAETLDSGGNATIRLSVWTEEGGSADPPRSRRELPLGTGSRDCKEIHKAHRLETRFGWYKTTLPVQKHPPLSLSSQLWKPSARSGGATSHPPPPFSSPSSVRLPERLGKKKPMCSSSATKHTAGQRQTPGPPPSDQAPGVGCPPLLSSNAARLSRPMAASLLSRAMLSLGMITWARSLVIREIS